MTSSGDNPSTSPASCPRASSRSASGASPLCTRVRHLLPPGELLGARLAVVRLRPPGDERGLLVDHDPLVGGRLPADPGGEVADELLRARPDLRSVTGGAYGVDARDWRCNAGHDRHDLLCSQPRDATRVSRAGGRAHGDLSHVQRARQMSALLWVGQDRRNDHKRLLDVPRAEGMHQLQRHRKEALTL